MRSRSFCCLASSAANCSTRARSRTPDGAQLEIGEALVAFRRASEILLERVELLLDTHGGAFLELEPVEQPVALLVEGVQFLLELRTVAEQRDEPLVLRRHVPAREPGGEPTQAVGEAHAAPGAAVGANR